MLPWMRSLRTGRLTAAIAKDHSLMTGRTGIRAHARTRTATWMRYHATAPSLADSVAMGLIANPNGGGYR